MKSVEVFRRPVIQIAGNRDPHGNRRIYGRIHTPKEWIGQDALCISSYTAADGTQCAEGRIYHITRKDCGKSVCGFFNVPKEWIGTQAYITLLEPEEATIPPAQRHRTAGAGGAGGAGGAIL